VNNVGRYGEREIASDRPWLCGLRIGGANDSTQNVNGVRALEDHQHDGPARNMVNEFLEERFSLVNAVKRLGLLSGYVVKT